MSVLYNEAENINFRDNGYPEIHDVKQAILAALSGGELEERVAVLESEMEDTAKKEDIAPTFSGATAYTAGDVVYYDGSLYRFTADHATGAWDSADVESVTVDDLVDGLKPVDSITDGDMRPVTSNAVAALSLADRDLFDWANAVDTAANTEYTPTKNGIMIAHGAATEDDAFLNIRDITLTYPIATSFGKKGTGLAANAIAVKGHTYKSVTFNTTSTLTFVPFK